MLSYLLDENISPVVYEQLVSRHPHIRVESVHRWQGGIWMGQADENLLRAARLDRLTLVLRAARLDRLTLVTYDLKTIPALLSEMAAEGEAHAGVLLVDDASLRNSDFGGLIRALLAHWQQWSEQEWENRIAFLTARS